MLSDSYLVPECAVVPRSFGGLMALYESNFIKLSNLLGPLAIGERTDEGRALSSTVTDECLSLSIQSREKYTVEITLTYLFDELTNVAAEPNLSVRVYLDARMAEVRGWANYRRHRVLAELGRGLSSELGRRWSENMMLSKWLDYLSDCGHSFLPRDAESLDREAEIA